ncbi:MAG: toxin-antitoxin system YwqK family antitoxin [Lentimicrobium sp.]|nr:toxin-antitoxin system YwqK family antitoxin [Lentimicrobium sp.]
MKYIILLLCFLSTITPLSLSAQDSLNQMDENGRRQGAWQKTDPLGRLIYKGNFENDKPQGTFIYFDTTGKVKAETRYSANGNEAFTTSYYPNGRKMSEGLYLNEKREGEWKFFNQDTILISEEHYENGQGVGVWKNFYQNGALLEEITYKNGVKDGPWKQYYYDGPLKLSAKYINGKLEELATFYHPNGRVMISGPYKSHRKDGVWMYMDDKGVAEKKEVWADGFLMAEEYYNKELERMVKEEK